MAVLLPIRKLVYFYLFMPTLSFSMSIVKEGGILTDYWELKKSGLRMVSKEYLFSRLLANSLLCYGKGGIRTWQ